MTYKTLLSGCFLHVARLRFKSPAEDRDITLILIRTHPDLTVGVRFDSNMNNSNDGDDEEDDE